MNKIVKKVLSQVLDTSEKIHIPDNFNRVLIDIGTSYNAPHSEVWTEKFNNICVFSFEPNPFNIECLKNGCLINSNWQNPFQLKIEKIGSQVFLIETALSNGKCRTSDFYCTDGDSGTSSLFEPNSLVVKDKIKVSVITLKDFFDLFPWGKIPFIEHIKIDAQSSDFDIILGMGDYIEKILYLTVESHTNDNNGNPYYKNYGENPIMMKEYIESRGFECKRWNQNGVFYNKNMKELWDKCEYYFLEDN